MGAREPHGCCTAVFFGAFGYHGCTKPETRSLYSLWVVKGGKLAFFSQATFGRILQKWLNDQQKQGYEIQSGNLKAHFPHRSFAKRVSFSKTTPGLIAKGEGTMTKQEGILASSCEFLLLVTQKIGCFEAIPRNWTGKFTWTVHLDGAPLSYAARKMLQD